MMRTPQLAGVLVFYIGRRLERIGGTPESALHPGSFAFRNGHVAVSILVRAGGTASRACGMACLLQGNPLLDHPKMRGSSRDVGPIVGRAIYSTHSTR